MSIQAWLERCKAFLAQYIPQSIEFKSFFTQAQDIYPGLAGIDFDASSILCVKLSKALGKIRVIQADKITLPPGLVDEDNIVNASQFVSAVKPGINLLLPKSLCAIAMPGSKVVMRQIKLEKRISESEAEHLAWQEAKKAFPGLIKNLLLDFVLVDYALVTNQRANVSAAQILLLVIARREDLMPRVDILKQVGLTTKIVDVDYYAIARAYPLLAAQLSSKQANRPVAIFNFDPQSLVFLVMHASRMIYMNRQTLPSHTFVPPVQQIMNVGNTSENTVFLTEEQKAMIVSQCQRLLQGFYVEFAEVKIEHTILTGRCALIPGIQEIVQNAVNIPTTIGNPFATQEIDHISETQHGIQLGPAFVLSYGLAMRGMSTWK